MSATDLINKFSRERKSIAWVVDEFSGTAGIVTMEDLLEEDASGRSATNMTLEEFEEKKLSNDEFIFTPASLEHRIISIRNMSWICLTVNRKRSPVISSISTALFPA